MTDPTSAEFFEQCRTAALAAIGRPDVGGYSHGFGLKVTIGAGERTREHYEAQLVRTGDRGPKSIVLEIGFHAEYPKAERNDDVLRRLLASEKKWRRALGPDTVAGDFLGNDRWRRISETWDRFDFRDPDLVFEVADRLADYVDALEPHLDR